MTERIHRNHYSELEIALPDVRLSGNFKNIFSKPKLTEAEWTQFTIEMKINRALSCRYSLLVLPRRFISTATLFASLFVFFGISSFSRAGDYTYATIGGHVTITGYTGPGGALAIPGTIAGFPVTSLGSGAFQNQTSLASVSIPNTITTIGALAFQGCSSLTAISVSSLNSSYSSVNGVLFNKSQTTLIQYPGGKAGSYTIPNNVTVVGANAFNGCAVLDSVTIPSSTTTLGGAVFAGCTSLTGVSIPNSVINIGAYAFNNCTGLISITIPNSVKLIREGIFQGCTSLTDIEIPDSVTNLGDRLFWGCASLATVTIPNSVTNIGAYAFNSCKGLTSVTIPNSVIRIGEYAFTSCVGLTNASIPNSINSLGAYAFSACNRLTSVAIPNTVTSLAEGVFYECGSLTNATIPNSITNIGVNAFIRCRALNSISIPDSVTAIESGAFNGCIGLTGVYFKGNTPAVGLDVFASSDKVIAYYLPGTTGWASTLGGRPALLWNPGATITDPTFGIGTGNFGFIITGTANITVVVEASESVDMPSWTPVSTNNLVTGSSMFSDPQWANYPTRIYRFRSP